ncbi:MAG TPA: type II CAAX endopeptidase family protein [Burkholderiaceae bacterium]|jgi:membrane protease YdiL (CAAX protease family)|nr:type II CAAX endopeptidase family protein [Burkholderiaceae bacterium]
MTTLSLARRPFVEITDLRLRLWPVLLAGALMQGVLWPARELARAIAHRHADFFNGHVWAFVGLAMAFQTLAGLACIAVMRRVLPRAPTYLRWPARGRSLVGLALAIGVGMGVLMLAADYWPQLAAHRAPAADYGRTPGGIAGWLAVMACSGLCEEPIFRGLLVGLLTALVPGRLRVGRVDLPVAGVLVALLFGLAHYESFRVDPLPLAIAQQLYAFAFGLVYVWLMERSRSLLAAVVAHGVGDAVEVGAVVWLQAAWGGH